MTVKLACVKESKLAYAIVRKIRINAIMIITFIIVNKKREIVKRKRIIDFKFILRVLNK